MTLSRRLFALLALAALGLPAAAADKPKRLLLVTHSGGFVHNSVGTAEDVMKKIGEQHGYDVTCYRYTAETTPKKLDDYNKRFRGPAGRAAETENSGRINKETLKNFDAVLFLTTGSPLTGDETKDLCDWVRAGGAFCGSHCATDTLYDQPAYGDLIGAYFRGHPAGLKSIKIHVEDPKHPAAAGFTDGMSYKDEIYVFRDQPYDRSKLHIIFSCESLDTGAKLKRADNDYAVSWCRDYGKGKVFYTSLGHQPQVWQDPKFQAHLCGGIDWALGRASGSAAPSGAKK